MLRKIRDEVHRFSVEYHRIFRLTQFSESILKNIGGLGDKRYEILFTHYKSIKKMSLDSASEMRAKTKIPIMICRKILTQVESFK